MNQAYSRIIRAAPQDRRDLFVSTARRVGTTEQNVEKDFWVCWTLDALFHGRHEGAPRLLFKGGTSLSKAFSIIRRFSEDIDITVFRHDLGEPASIDDLEKLSGKKRRAQLDEIRSACQRYLAGDLRPEMETLLAGIVPEPERQLASVILDQDDPDGQTLLLRYPGVLPTDAYVRPAVRIECGAKSALDPHVEVSVRPYISDDIADLDLTIGGITAIQPTRTFWDKIVILHGIRGWFEKRGELRQEGQRVSRHYYDLHVMYRGGIGEEALTDRELGAECVRHARMFFNRPDFNLETAVDGTFAIEPIDGMVEGLRRDYEAMAGMIVGQAPPFGDVLASIAALEHRLNGVSVKRE
jgi:hypothetical protein